MLLFVSSALLSATFAENPAGYATAGNNTTAAKNMTTAATPNVSAQINPGAKTTYVSQLANVSAIFGLNKAEGMNITRVNTVGNKWVEIANVGIATWNMSGWKLTNRKNTTYVFPVFNLTSGSTVRVHEGAGKSSGTDLYTNNTMPLFNNSGDMITLLDPAGERAAVYTISGNVSVPTTAPVTTPALVNATVKSPGTQPVLITPGTPGISRSPATAPLLFNATTAPANVTTNVTCPAGQTFCNGTCTDTSIDAQNCGACGNKCPPESTCIDGTCSSPCLPGQTSCNGTCVDISADSQNCGACGRKCPP